MVYQVPANEDVVFINLVFRSYPGFSIFYKGMGWLVCGLRSRLRVCSSNGVLGEYVDG